MGSLLPARRRRRRWWMWIARMGFGTVVLTVYKAAFNPATASPGHHSLGYLALVSAVEAVAATLLLAIVNRWLPARPRTVQRPRRRELPPGMPWRRDGG